MIHDLRLAVELAEARASAAPRATEPRMTDAAGWLCAAVAIAMLVMMLVQGWLAAGRAA